MEENMTDGGANDVAFLNREYDEVWDCIQNDYQHSKSFIQLYVLAMTGLFAVTGLTIEHDSVEIRATGLGVTLVVVLTGWLLLSFMSFKLSHLILNLKHLAHIRKRRLDSLEAADDFRLAYGLPLRSEGIIIPNSWKHTPVVFCVFNYLLLFFAAIFYWQIKETPTSVAVFPDDYGNAIGIAALMSIAYGMGLRKSLLRFRQRLLSVIMADGYEKRKFYEEVWNEMDRRNYMKLRWPYYATLLLFAILCATTIYLDMIEDTWFLFVVVMALEQVCLMKRLHFFQEELEKPAENLKKNSSEEDEKRLKAKEFLEKVLEEKAVMRNSQIFPEVG
jgi:hypothetical protein